MEPKCIFPLHHHRHNFSLNEINYEMQKLQKDSLIFQKTLIPNEIHSKPLFLKKTTTRLGFPGGSVVKNLPANAGDAGSIPGSGRSLEKEMATHSSILAWEIPWRGAWRGTVHGVAGTSDTT